MDWDAKDIGLLGGALAATLADVETTKADLRRGEEENNPILGKHPSNSSVNAAGALSGLGGFLAANALPKKYRKAFLGAWAGMEARLAYQNKITKDFGGFSGVMKKPILAGLVSGLLAHHFLNDEESGVSVGPGALGPMSIKVEKKF